MPYENNNDRNNETIFSKRLKAGKLRTYFFDVRSTRTNDYFVTLTESKKRFNDGGYDRHKLFLYKEDFNKFLKGLGEAVDYVKTELMPDFDFDAFNHDTPYEGDGAEATITETGTNAVVDEVRETQVDEVKVAVLDDAPAPSDNGSSVEVDKW